MYLVSHVPPSDLVCSCLAPFFLFILCLALLALNVFNSLKAATSYTFSCFVHKGWMCSWVRQKGVLRLCLKISLLRNQVLCIAPYIWVAVTPPSRKPTTSGFSAQAARSVTVCAWSP